MKINLKDRRNILLLVVGVIFTGGIILTPILMWTYLKEEDPITPAESFKDKVDKLINDSAYNDGINIAYRYIDKFVPGLNLNEQQTEWVILNESVEYINIDSTGYDLTETFIEGKIFIINSTVTNPIIRTTSEQELVIKDSIFIPQQIDTNINVFLGNSLNLERSIFPSIDLNISQYNIKASYSNLWVNSLNKPSSSIEVDNSFSLNLSWWGDFKGWIDSEYVENSYFESTI